MEKQILCGFGVDIDAVAGWLGSYGGEDSPSDIQRGMFAGEVGVPRLLKLFDKFKLKASWFIPGHSIETFPEQTAMIVTAGHEIGAHGYSHENPVAMTRRQEEDVLKKSIELIEKFSGKKPRGYVAPWWEMSAVTAELLLQNGFRYDHSQAYHDFLRSMHGSEIPEPRSTIQNRRPIGCIRCSAARRSIWWRSAPTGTSTICRR